jgi:hypothetical protein
MLRVGDTLVPMIFMSDGTHLSIVTCHKPEWSVYLKVGNLSAKIRQILSMDGTVMVTFQPRPIKNCNSSQKQLDEKRQTKREVLNTVLQCILQPLNIRQNPSTTNRYYNVL